jgi:shikimate kinase
MNTIKRVFLIGHPGAGKALVAKLLAEKLGWKFIDADLGLETRVGSTIHNILGQGESHFYDCQHEILSELCSKDNIVVTTDPSVVCSDKLCERLSSEFVVYLTVSMPVQMERTSSQSEFLLSKLGREALFEKLHQERDALYQKVSNMHVNSDDSALEEHVARIMKMIPDDTSKKK